MSGRRGFFSADTVERVRMASDIGSVVGRYVDLKTAGRSMKGLCPFHKEKTPSFFVSPERQTYHCFGCGAGGDVFSFLMNYLSYSFREAVEELASEAGIPIEYSSSGEASRTDIFREIMAEAHSFCRKQYLSEGGQRAREYIEGRSLSSETAESLGIGWAPSGSRLTTYLRKAGYSESHLVESGITIRSGGGDLYDRFRDRLVFPICDRRGRTISLGGRTLRRDSDVPKYINGPDSPVYRKGDYLYGYHEAAPSARDLDMVILVEGYFDHARLWDAGFACTVATCGTALTPAQARQLGTLSPNIFICYDGDAAGRRAAVKAAEIVLQQGHFPKMMSVPDGLDPDDYIRESGPDGVLGLAGNAKDPVRFALGLLGAWSGITDSVRKVRAVRRLVSVASSAANPVVEETLLKIISTETGYSLETLGRQLAEEQEQEALRSHRKPKAKELNKWDSAIIAALLLSADDGDEDVLRSITDQDMRSEEGVRIVREITRQREEGLEEFQLSLLDDGDAALCSAIYSNYPDRIDPEEKQKIWSAVTRARLELQLRELKARLMTARGDEKSDINSRISELGRRLMRMQR